ncbi:2-oxo acid dehydrogenase subunit E2 [Pseudonocardia sp. C8]|uniref:dihydrolipoamide acetyltransferase family protein n=1 Tax=Pseudonocardia sp. C8 TaxID=2762759 RepID=UPI001642B81B|nr:dihydrolipoamide acetyltransferase family protein [Pseudonocardia sp. C8]MBC3194598.1 2-oxo acid dehydrogenase subunit E2 [Pseudonocardia sp. C8]
MRELFKLPDVGEGLTEAEIVAWRVGPGDTVAVNDVIVEIETAKAAVELPSPWAGTVGELLAEPGSTVEVGTPIIAIDTAGSGGGAAGEDGGAKIGEAGKDGRIATLVGYGPRQGPVKRRPRRGTAAGGGDAPAAHGATGPSGATGSPAGTGAEGPAGVAADGPGATAADGPAGVAAAGAVGPAEAAEVRTEVPGPAPGDASPDSPAPVDASGAGGSRRSADTSGGTTGAPGSGPVGGLVPLAPPPVRLLARELGVDLQTVTGTGGDGRITREDVRAAAESAAGAAGTPAPAAGSVASPSAGGVPAGGAAGVAAAAGAAGAAGAAAGLAGGAPGSSAAPAAAAAGPATARPAGDRREPIRGVRKATAAAMVSSAFTAPHVTEFLDVDVTATMALRDRLKGSREFADVKLTPLAFVAKAVCLAAARTPAVNASWDERAGEIVYYEHVQLGIAAATPRGLVVPKIRDADRLGLHELAVALGELTETARAGRTAPADLVGGTLTITNVGVFGVDSGTPILNPGESAILAVGSIKPAPWVVDGELAVRTVCRLALSFDHRVVDGAEGSRFLADVGALLEDPGVAFTW